MGERTVYPVKCPALKCHNRSHPKRSGQRNKKLIYNLGLLFLISDLNIYNIIKILRQKPKAIGKEVHRKQMEQPILRLN